MSKSSRRDVIGLLIAVAAGSCAFITVPLASDVKPLAIKGYDPVAYFTAGAPMRGLPDIEYEWDEYRYRFARPAHRELFEANPARYAPQFANFCAMALAKGVLYEADPESWLIHDGKLYVFGGPAGRHQFQQSLAENIAKAHRNRSLVQRR
ncbi:YHS domain-containing (seleno)protein [Microvirga roseola]|uniref:YHS domain-containing (seleno)protein n=1 Tax=Microvirga roseola TaxID=2883126 RepID=UPI001E35B07D|nr:YHS domain-containing (seleno)protein [Microvirga roseola]